jgi:hypothetical protein
VQAPLPNHYQSTTKPPPNHHRWNRAPEDISLTKSGRRLPEINRSTRSGVKLMKLTELQSSHVIIAA